MNNTINPLHPAQRLADAPRCTATAKRTGCRCKAPAVRGWSVCRMHGARGGAPCGQANGRWRHGERTKEAEQENRELKKLLHSARQTIGFFGRR